MDWLLAWDHLIFVVPISVGTLFAVGAMLGLHAGGHAGGHAHVSAHAHAGAHASTHAHAHSSHRQIQTQNSTALSRAVSYLGLSRAPMPTMSMLMTFAFGIPGLSVDLVLESLPGRGVFALAAAVAGFVFITLVMSRLMSKFMPSDESTAIGPEALLGQMASSDFDTPPDQPVYARTKDSTGTLFQVTVKVQDTVRKGDLILLTDYNPDTQQYSGSLGRD